MEITGKVIQVMEVRTGQGPKVVIEKKCKKCLVIKPIDDFYKNVNVTDGHLNTCKECVKEREKNRRKSSMKDPFLRDRLRKSGRDKYKRNGRSKRPAHKEREVHERYRKKYPEKARARRAASFLKKTKGFQFHHWSYNKEHYKDVIELTKENHFKAHRFLVYDQERMMYRTVDGVLLNTKESHLEYILDKIKNED